MKFIVQQQVSSEPEYLTALDIASILGISPHMALKLCQENDIPAWRALGDRGEYRVDTTHFRLHPKYEEFLKQRTESLMQNHQLLENIKRISRNDKYGQMMDHTQLA